MILDQFIEEFIEDVCAGKDNLTPVAYRRKLVYLKEYLKHENLTLRRIDSRDMARFVRYLQTRNTKRCGKRIVKGKLSPWTIKTVLGTTKHFFRWCQTNRKLWLDPMMGVKIPRTPAPLPKAISADTVDKLLHAAATYGEEWMRYRNLVLIYLLRDTGGRRMGIANAEIDYLELRRRRLYVTDKGGKHCVLRLSENTKKAIELWLPVREKIPPLDNRLLTGRLGYGIVPGTINSILRILGEHAGITMRKNPHSFRHAFARDLLQNHADLTTVSQLMHHSSIAVTADYYARWADDELQRAHALYSPGRNLPPPDSLLEEQ